MKQYKIALLLFAIICSSCKNEGKIESVIDTPKKEVIQLTNKEVNSEGVFLFTSENEQLISWTEHGKNKKETTLKFAFFNQKTNVFEQAITVPPAKGLQLHSESMA